MLWLCDGPGGHASLCWSLMRPSLATIGYGKPGTLFRHTSGLGNDPAS